NVTPTFDAYDWSYDITSVGVTAGGSGVPGDITWRFDAVADLDGSGTGGPLPLVIYDATWDEPDTGTLLDVEISVDSSGQARVLFDEIALGDLETDFGASSIPIDTLIVSGTISVAGRAAGLPGDYNGDDQVNAQDYTLWQVTFGSTTILAADGNGDGVVDAADYSVWRDASDAQSAAAAAIPEPAATVLAALAAARLLMRRAAS
ncbi:MAG: dockerin type I domain-containing protein, partial [Planctomycetota bacterium]